MHIALDLFSTVVESLFIIKFLTQFNKSKMNIKLGCAFVLIYFSINVLSIGLPIEASPLYSLIYFAAILAYSLIICNKHFLRGTLAAIIMQVSIIISNTVAIFIFSIALKLNIEDVLAISPVFSVILYSVSKILLWLIISFFAKLLDPKESQFKWQDSFLLIFYPVFIFIELLIVFKLAFEFPDHNFVCYLITGLLIASYIGVTYLTNRTIKKEHLLAEKELQLQALEFNEKNYIDIKQSLEDLHKAKHDLKNKLFTLKAEIDSGNITKVKENLDMILDSADSLTFAMFTGDRLLDYIINTKLKSVAKKSIIMNCDIAEFDIIKDIDLSIILGNALDNAVEALNKIQDGTDKEVVLTFYTKGNYLNILCSNTITESVLDTNPNLKSTKKSSEHGFGISSIKDIAAKYNGLVDIYEQNSNFCVHIIIPKSS